MPNRGEETTMTTNRNAGRRKTSPVPTSRQPLGEGGLLGIMVLSMMALILLLFAPPKIARAVTAITQEQLEAYSLSEPEWNTYLQIKEKFEQVANGETTSAIFDIDVSGLLGQSVWSADDYGEEPAMMVDAMDGKGVALHVVASFNGWFVKSAEEHLKRILTVLKWENPEISDWLKENEYPTIKVKWDIRSENDKCFVSAISTTLYCPVLPMYRGETQYEIRPDIIEKMRNGLPRAQAIADQYAGEPAMKRIESYSNAIHELSSYAQGTTSDDIQTNSMPWSIISVFDGDPSTRSVCAAYSRALGLLIKLSGRDDISCHMAQGYCKTKTVEGEHMWCVIKMPDGKNYFADITADSPSMRLIVAPMAGTPDDGYAGGNKFYTYDEQTRNAYKTNVLCISDTPYCEPDQPEETPSEQISEQSEPATSLAVETELTEGEKEPLQAEETQAWTIPIVDNTHIITDLQPEQSDIWEGAARGIEEKAAGWVVVIKGLFVVCAIAIAAMTVHNFALPRHRR